MVNCKTSKGEMALAHSKMNRMFARGPAQLAVISSDVRVPIVPYLVKKGCTTRTFTLQSPVQDIAQWNPDGFIITGSGHDEDPKEGLRNHYSLISYIKETRLPVFGIGLGHQLLALSEDLAVSVKQMQEGQLPVKNRMTGKLEVKQLQSACYLKIQPEDLSKVDVTHVNINEQNAEGLQYKRFPGFSVQYIPTAADYLLNHFIDLMQMWGQNCRKRNISA